jgi:GT2 family glycosyltransferase
VSKNSLKKYFELGIILIDYKTAQQSIDYFNSVIKKLNINYVLFVLNNTNDFSTSNLIAEKIGAKVVRKSVDFKTRNNKFVFTAGDNLGYARGNNLAYEILKRQFEMKYLLITNNDISVNNPTRVVKKLISKLEANKDIGVVGPTIIGHDGRNQSPSAYKTIWETIILRLFFYPILRPFLKDFGFTTIHKAKEGYCYRVMGSFMLLRESAFIEVGKFDDATFLYAEEMILTERMLARGYKTYYCFTPPVIHVGGQTTKKYFSAREKWKNVFKSEVYYYKKYKNARFIEVFLANMSIFLYLNVYLKITIFLNETIKNIKLEKGN